MCTKSVPREMCSYIGYPKMGVGTILAVDCKCRRAFQAFYTLYIFLPSIGAVCPGKGNNGMFTREPLSFRLIAVKMPAYVEKRNGKHFSTMLFVFIRVTFIVCVFADVDLRDSQKRKFDDAGVSVANNDYVIGRMAAHLLSSRSDNTVNKYHHKVRASTDL